jgi:lysophospholipase L1-like esterase
MQRRQFLAATAAGLAAAASTARFAVAVEAAAAAPTNAAPPAGSPRAAAAAAATKPSRTGADVVWHDVRDWGVEGRGFGDTENYFDRLPARAKSVVREAVWDLSRHTSGMAAFFEADAPELFVRYQLLKADLAMPHMPATGVSGVDLYGMAGGGGGGWRWLATHLPRGQAIRARLVAGIAPGRRRYHLNLPLYNGVTSLEIGVPRGATFTPVAPRADKPVLFYGTSITQGGCASRPGMSFTNILRRRLDRPVLNFGFSGNGKTEVEVARFLVELDPAAFVLDTSANTPAQQLGERTEAVVKLIRERHPHTPVLLLDERQRDGFTLAPGLAERHRAQHDALRGAYNNLCAAGVRKLYFHAGDELTGTDEEGTVDGSHPTDLGMLRYADALEPVLRRVLSHA